ncbi:hypothetical protein [Streptomyces sp. NBC_00151]|uniref:hypothetical protein n=1 Tax=Streptomyces sp. NBC_00151 TaxID=2975669 RepID=UPI002DD938D5|nr:hypothetical protein [Streptomyces sp. NBC_00151]WRZ42237.1 hypothetical protein OG915_31890 [Streptomyces sp. NBC_00151]
MSGSLRTQPGAHEATRPLVPSQRRSTSWGRPDPIDELAADLAEFVTAAVHPDEVAALLESDGLSDDQIRERYGVTNSFALAEELFERVERGYPEPGEPAPDPWRTGLIGCLLRGIVFALPGLGYVLAGPLLAGPKGAFGLPAGTVPMLAGALCGWTWNQGLAHRAYTWMGLGDRSAARRALLVGTPAGVLLGSLVAFAAAGSAGRGAVAFAAGQSGYLGAATVLLVMGRERMLLAALAPMTAGAAVTVFHPVPDLARMALLLGSLAAVALLGLLEVAPAVRELGEGSWGAGLIALLPYGRLRGGAEPSGRAGEPRAASAGRPAAGKPGTAPGRLGTVAARLRARRSAAGRHAGTVAYALFGLGSGVLVLYAALGDVLTGARTAVAAPAAVALTLSMGPAEWLLFRFRSGSLAGLRSSTSVRSFRRASAGTLLRCLTGYLASLLVLGLGVSALWPHAPAAADGVRLGGLLLLGVVMWTGLLLQSFGAVTGTAAVVCAAALVQTAALVTHTGDAHWVGLIVYGAAAGAQTLLVCARLGKVTAHR